MPRKSKLAVRSVEDQEDVEDARAARLEYQLDKVLALLEAIAYQTSGGQMEFHDYIGKIYSRTMHKLNEVDHELSR